MTYVPRFFLIWGFTLISGLTATILTRTAPGGKIDKTRYAIFKFTAEWMCYLKVITSGYLGINQERKTSICYKKYLGPDWNPVWTGAPTMITNHRSWLDIMIGYS